jgi:hypothetical protein
VGRLLHLPVPGGELRRGQERPSAAAPYREGAGEQRRGRPGTGSGVAAPAKWAARAGLAGRRAGVRLAVRPRPVALRSGGEHGIRRAPAPPPVAPRSGGEHGGWRREPL